MIKFDELCNFTGLDFKTLELGLKVENLIKLVSMGYIDKIAPFFLISPKECQAIIDGKKFPLDMVNELMNCTLDLKSEYFFVRSSAQYEDVVGKPTAGLFLTEGKIQKESLVAVVKRCIDHSQGNVIQKILGEKPSISIIIQKMIFPKFSGVLFTVHPVNNDTSLIIIEASYGLCETVVSGKFPVDHYEISKNSLKEPENVQIKQIISPKNSFISTETNSIIETPKDLISKSTLSIEDIIALASISLDVEFQFGGSVDIEWAIDLQNRVWFLQLRAAQ
jgi:phosphoenolpyruvate synthase/pyruvate phosphate dikinase